LFNITFPGISWWPNTCCPIVRWRWRWACSSHCSYPYSTCRWTSRHSCPSTPTTVNYNMK